MTDDPNGVRTPMMEQILDEGSSGAAELAVLTDADLLALDGPDATAVAPLPWLGGHGADARRFAAEVAGRQLLARGLVGADLSGGQERVDAQRLSAVLALRTTATAYLVAEQQVTGSTQTLVAYVHTRDRSVLEETTSNGLHRFVAAPTATVLEDITSWVLPDPGEGVDGPAEDLSLAEFEQRVTTTLADTRRVSVLVGVRNRPGKDRERRMTAYAMPAAAVVALPLGTGQLRLVPVSRTTLTGLVASLVGD